MTTPQEQRVKAGPQLGSRLEFFKLDIGLSVAPGQKTTADLIAAAAAAHNAQADTLGGTHSVSGVDFNEVQKDTDSQARLDYVVAAINVFAQPIMLTVADDGMSINFAFEHLGAATAAQLKASVDAAILAKEGSAAVTTADVVVTKL